MLILSISDAIFGLRELLNTYPTLVSQLLAPLVMATVRLTSDEVRALDRASHADLCNNTEPRTKTFDKRYSRFTDGLYPSYPP